MVILIGLGNPGQTFENTRHNFGFMVIDAFAEKNNFPDFSLSKKFNSLISEGTINEKKVLLAKPQTFMNESGKTAKRIIENWKYKPVAPLLVIPSELRKIENLIVVHDDIDLPLGEIKIVKNRGSAGHKGVESIIKEIGTKNFIRFRIGIRPQRTHGLVRGTERFVLQKLSKTEKKIMEEVIKKTAEALEITLKEGVEKAMSKYNC